MKSKISVILTIVFCSSFFYQSPVHAENIPEVVINEIAWAGSMSSGSDEWIELRNNTSTEISLNEYKLEDDAKVVLEFTGKSIPALGYFLIEKREESTSKPADLIFSGMSLANDGDVLRLLKGTTEVDNVNPSGGAWAGGSSTKKGTMSRIDSKVSGGDVTNWQTEESESNDTDSGGMKILGTVKTENSKASSLGGGNTTSSGNKVSLELISTSLNVGDEISVLVKYSGDPGLFSYGLDLEYDKDLLSFRAAKKGDYLNEDGDIETSFQSSLEDNKEGILMISEARIETIPTGVTAESGNLAILDFEILEETLSDLAISIKNTSFLNEKDKKLNTSFSGLKFSLISTVSGLGNPENISALLGSERYSFLLSFEEVIGASAYVIYRRTSQTDFIEIARPTDNQYLDNKEIVPEVVYEYKVSAIISGNISSGVMTSIKETRGLIGDFDRNDRVDGHDLDKIAKAWTSEKGASSYNFSMDTNCDLKIDALDLFALGAHFGEIY